MEVQYSTPKEAESDRDEGEFTIAQKSQESGEGMVRVPRRGVQEHSEMAYARFKLIERP